MAGPPQIVLRGVTSYGHQQTRKRRLFITGNGIGTLIQNNPTYKVLLTIDGSTIVFDYDQPQFVSPNMIYVDFKYNHGNRGFGGDTDNVTITITDQAGNNTLAVGETQAAPDSNAPPP
jgi:hypothetical protein